MISGIYDSTYTATLHIRITVLKHTGYKNIKLMQGYTKKNCTLCVCAILFINEAAIMRK